MMVPVIIDPEYVSPSPACRLRTAVGRQFRQRVRPVPQRRAACGHAGWPCVPSPTVMLLEVFRAGEGVDLIREAVKVARRLAR